MARLVIAARERTKEYANLSWGVLSGLIRTLDARDHRAARHCAAVARFARDIAAHVGMTERDQELAHTAGLLHDIGRFALSDRVMERGVVLTEDDWTAIRRHPELGADMLRDIGVYGPLSEIIVAHHERPDGKGYPHGLTGEAIPEIAKIIAVAEVYDTLTAPDTYRTRLSSFEALTELRRVAGKQLDAGYVEALAELLAGQGTEYRHADAADYDEELAIERRMNEAAGGRLLDRERSSGGNSGRRMTRVRRASYWSTSVVSGTSTSSGWCSRTKRPVPVVRSSSEETNSSSSPTGKRRWPPGVR